MTHRGAISQGRTKIDGSIIGFNIVQGGNVDYWGLELEKSYPKKRMYPKMTSVKSEEIPPPCWSKKDSVE